MSEKPTGGPAFPVVIYATPVAPAGAASDGAAGGPRELVTYGMSLRDYFAAAALLACYAAMASNPAPGPFWMKKLASNAYEIADAMLEERER